MCRAASCFLLFPLCLLLRFVLISGAKVQRYLQPTKHFAKKVCIFNLLQQIGMFLPKFIHILSTKTAKCAIYKANFFAFRLITYVHYIKTNNKLYLQPLACVRVRVFCRVQSIFNHHYKLTYLCRVRVSCLVVFRTC